MRVPTALAAAAIVVLAAACQSTPAPEPAPPPPVFPDEWRVVDLTRPMDVSAPYLPHEESFPFERIPLEGTTAGRHAAVWSMLGLMGTHVEAPGIFEGTGDGIARIPVEHLVLSAVVLDAPPALGALDSEDAALIEAVGIPAILEHETRHGRIPHGSLVLLRTGDGDLASVDLALAGRVPEGGHAHRGWSEDAVRYLISERDVRALGTDALTIDPGDRLEASPAARAAADAGVYTLQALAGLGTMPRRGAVVVVAVLPVREALSAQARVIAFVPPPRPASPRNRTADAVEDAVEDAADAADDTKPDPEPFPR